ncbi:hypothetical protein [Flagellimonas onchidii]|uniref:hypothetical protein n=1 Tax=Flagellimonas onchidii TaxID=2562684 RepID=UPI0010A600B3|nr:hypothetical protein [Allomuricauda onchidii]
MKLKSFRTTILIILFTIFLGAFIGGTTNLINGYISPIYFKNIMRWDFENIWRACIAQGIFEGLLNGIIFSLIYSISFSVITKGNASLSFGVKQLLKITTNIYLLWAIGGIIALGLALLSPEFYQSTFRMVPTETKDMLAYAWVGGSIWGASFGSVIAITIGIINTKTNWKTINQ